MIKKYVLGCYAGKPDCEKGFLRLIVNFVDAKNKLPIMRMLARGEICSKSSNLFGIMKSVKTQRAMRFYIV